MKKRILAFISTFIVVVSALSTFTFAAALPQSYRTDTLGYLTGAQDQHSTGVCWAFTHNEVIAAYVAKNEGKVYDFSEQTIKFETSYATATEWGFNRLPNDGGNEYISTAYLSYAGSVLEKDEPFSESDVRTVNPDKLKRYGYLENTQFFNFGMYDLSNATTVGQRNQMRKDKANAIETIKEIVYQNGAVGSCMYYDYQMSSLYENTAKTNYNYNGYSATPNHAVTIVGWDDNYKKSNFKNVPEADGAFIVKNSWGNYHNNGKSCYFYVSYYDKFITSEFFSSQYKVKNNLFDNIYMYDGYGWTANGTINESSALCVSKFYADKQNEEVCAISTYVSQGGTTVDLYVNEGVGDYRDEKSYTKVKTVYFENPGYYLVEIEPIKLKKSGYYVGVRHTSKNGTAYFPIQTNAAGVSEDATNTPNTCFVASKFSTLTPIENVYPARTNPMHCIKAFTRSLSDTTKNTDKRFSDVSSGKWYEDEIYYCVSHNVFTGMTDKTFEPQTTMTRAMFVKVLANLSGDRQSVQKLRFTDVKNGSWYESAVSWGYKNGIVSGITTTSFAPNESITREQMCFMLMKFTEYMGIKLDTSNKKIRFTDEKYIRDYAKDAVSYCQTGGIISGNTDGSFAPRKSATRAEVAVMLSNLCQKYIY